MKNDTLSICIATYKRFKLLNKLINSIIDQISIEQFIIEIIIIDNDPNKSAEPIILEFKERLKNNNQFLIKYDMQPIKNISLTRNRSIEFVTGEYIFFIDDDEYAENNWIWIHLNNLKSYNADGLFGQVKSYFPEDIPEWIKGCYIYHRKTNPTGQPPANLNTGNCIIKSKFFIKDGYRFDPSYGITGGSDFHLFSKMQREGAKFLSCYEAITYEFVPESRANLNWLIKRAFRTGNNFTRTVITKNKKKNLLLSILEFFKGIIQAIIAFTISLFLLWNKSESLNWFLKGISNISKPFAVIGVYPEEYKHNKE